ncbi:MAG: hypothetical protein H3C50_10190 [Kiritimatiellae bacterium]|nr:hypothetical protein [Kiritimatiellia bacterium]MCO5069048.1 hypothetical protein [Kiritimatiellia bacterium]
MKMWIGIVLAAVCVGFATPALAQQPMEVEAMLILASNEPAPLDRRLERVDYLLRPVLRFETYRLLGQGSVLLGAGGSTSLALGDGHVLYLRMGKKGHVEVSWQRGEERLLSTSVGLQRNKPTILGGVPQGDGRLIVTLMVK